MGEAVKATSPSWVKLVPSHKLLSLCFVVVQQQTSSRLGSDFSHFLAHVDLVGVTPAAVVLNYQCVLGNHRNDVTHQNSVRQSLQRTVTFDDVEDVTQTVVESGAQAEHFSVGLLLGHAVSLGVELTHDEFLNATRAELEVGVRLHRVFVQSQGGGGHVSIRHVNLLLPLLNA